MAITPGGRVGNAGPVGTPGGRQNWVDKVGGLPRYIRMVAHAMIRKGHPESQAIRLAVGIVRNWAEGKGDVSPKVRAAAAAAIAEWEAKRARSHVDMSSDVHDGSGSVLNPGVDIRELDLSSVATGDVSHDRDATDVDLAPGDYRPPYDWKHGYIPITPAAVRSKRKLGGKTGRAKPPKGRMVAGVGKVKPGQRPSGLSGKSASSMSAAEKIKAVETMHGTGSPQHKRAVERFGAQAKAADDAARGRGVPGAVESARDAEVRGIQDRIEKRTGVRPTAAQARAALGHAERIESDRPKRAAAGSKKYAAQVTRANAGDLDPGLHAELRREGMLDADNHPTAKGKRAGLKPALEREAAMRANRKPGDITPPPDRSPEAQVRGLLRESRTPGLSETDRARKTAEAEKLATKHKLDAAALDEQVRQSMYEYRSGEGFVLKADGLTEADKVRAAGNHRRQAEVQRSRGNHEAAAHHEAEAAKYDPSSAKPATDEFSQRLKRRAALSRANAEAAGVRAKPDGTFNDTAGETLRKAWPVGQGVRAGVPGTDSSNDVIGTVTGHTDTGMIRVRYRNHRGEDVVGTFNPSHARKATVRYQYDARTNKPLFGEGRPEHLKGKSARELRAELTGRNDTPLSEKSDDELIRLTRHSDPTVARAAELEYARRGEKGNDRQASRVANATQQDGGFKPAGPGVQAMVLPVGAAGPKRRVADMSDVEVQTELAKLHGKSKADSTEADVERYADLANARHDRLEAGTWSGKRPNGKTQRITAQGMDLVPERNAEARAATGAREGFVTNAGLPPDRDRRGLIVTGKPKDSTGGDLPASPTADQIGAASTSDLENRLRTIEAVNPSSPVARQIAAELNERHRVGRGGGGMDTSQRARVTQAEGGAADRRAQEAAVSRGDYSNADGPVLAAEAVRRGLLSSGTGRGSAEAKSDSQLRTALKKHDREKVHSGDQSTRAAAAQTLAAARADKARLDAGGKARSDAIAQGRTQPSDTELDRGAISPTTARKMTDDQLDAAVRRLMASGTYSGPGLKVLEDELNRRDKARAGKARGR